MPLDRVEVTMTTPSTTSVPINDENDKRILDHLLRHIVSFSGSYYFRSSPHEERLFSYSGFLVEIKGRWYVMTAGHIFHEIDKAMEANELVFTGRVLADNFGQVAKHALPIPFDYEDHDRIHVYRDGLDFALIALTELETRQLEANGRQPFTIDGRPERPWADYDGFAILGFPEENLQSDIGEKTGPVALFIQPGLAPVRYLPVPPEDVDVPKYPRFMGELLDSSKPASIVGMSGGPVIGFKRQSDGLDYWVVAIQSKWLESKRITYGCPLPVVFQVLRAAVEEHEKTGSP